MPSIAENKNVWGEVYDWENTGEEWSGSFGTSKAHWLVTIFPRIENFLKEDGTILEIAPGFGRWTQYLKNNCKELNIIDLNSNCIEHCKEKFKVETKINYFVNDGKSLDMIKDDSIDFVFSYDSLVHVNQEVMENYLAQLSNKLKEGAFCFLHHSNLAMYKNQNNQRVDYPVLNWRDEEVDASFVRDICFKYNLHCLTQELLNWNGDLYTDCYSVIQKDSSCSKNKLTKVFHSDISIEQNYARKLSQYYINCEKKCFSDETISEIQKNTDILAKRLTGKKTAFYGAGNFAKGLVPSLNLNNLMPICFFDSDKNKTCFEIADIEIKHISEISAIEPDAIIMTMENPKVALPGLKEEIKKNGLNIELIDIQEIDIKFQ